MYSSLIPIAFQQEGALVKVRLGTFINTLDCGNSQISPGLCKFPAVSFSSRTLLCNLISLVRIKTGGIPKCTSVSVNTSSLIFFSKTMVFVNFVTAFIPTSSHLSDFRLGVICECPQSHFLLRPCFFFLSSSVT